MQTFLFIVSWLLFGFATAYFAKQRGRDPYIWFLVGTLFGILGLIFLFVLPNRSAELPIGEELDPAPSENVLPVLPHHDYAIKEWFYYDRQKQRVGPISYDELKTSWKNEQLDEESFVWCEGMFDWQPVKNLPNLLEHLNQ